jgi:hypothetical protein
MPRDHARAARLYQGFGLAAGQLGLRVVEVLQRLVENQRIVPVAGTSMPESVSAIAASSLSA